MTEQLALIPEPPRPLTARQQEALEHVQAAGQDGITAAELGQLMYGYRPEAKSWGQSTLQALRRRGLVAERRRPHRHYVAVNANDRKIESNDHPPPDGLAEFGSMPAGY